MKILGKQVDVSKIKVVFDETGVETIYYCDNFVETVDGDTWLHLFSEIEYLKINFKLSGWMYMPDGLQEVREELDRQETLLGLEKVYENEVIEAQRRLDEYRLKEGLK